MCEKQNKKGIIMVLTGNGKGKTTSSLGQAFRAIGHNYKVLVVQFIKGTWKYGELETAKRLTPNIEIHPMGKGYIFENQTKEERTKHTKAAIEAFNYAKQRVIEDNIDMLILDEINNTLDTGTLDLNIVLDFLKSKPAELDIILTGRGAPNKLIEIADLVTEMKEIKHPYQKGITSRKGIEF